MKTVAEIAKDVNMSVQTIYRTLNRVKQETGKCLTEKKNGITHITDEGEQMLKEHLPDVKQDEKMFNIVKQPENDVKQAEKEEIIFLRDQNKLLQEELAKEREHSRSQANDLQNKIINQSDRIADLAEKLAELTRNSQILHKQEQDKNALSSPEQPPTVSSAPDANDTKLKQRPFWQFWKK